MAKIFIDPGHGNPSKNPGATYGSRKEATDVIKLSKKVGELLKAQGVEVKYSRADNEDPELSARCKAANSWGADYFISIHRNAFKPNAAKGCEVWVYSKVTTNGDTYNKAKRINDIVCSAVGFANRGIKKGAPSYTDYAVNRETNMNSCLLECGFVDSDTDNKLFDSKFDAMAEAIAKGLCEAVGVKYTEKKVSTETKKTEDKGVIYTVQAGAFSSKANAEAYAEKIKKAGFDCYVTTKSN